MILFLDVASPIPEFNIITDKKIINSTKIIEDFDQKLSDRLIPVFLELNKKHNFSHNIKKLIITSGPGSYTALRIGASFIAGLSESMDLPVAVISSETIYIKYFGSSKDTGIYFESSNNQKFFSYIKGSKFLHVKVDTESYSLPESFSLVYYNYSPPKFFNKKTKVKSFSLKNAVINILNNLEFNKKILKPIYISNNTILN